jgi:hypothetical protein
MARPTTARAAPAPFEAAPPVAGGTGVPVLELELDGPTGVLDPVAVERVTVALLEEVGTPVPVPVTMVVEKGGGTTVTFELAEEDDSGQ